jgi:hypothetical protein
LRRHGVTTTLVAQAGGQLLEVGVSKIVILIPYCPLPIDTGGKVEMWKHMRLLRELGECTILSSASRPVGTPWSKEHIEAVKSEGFNVVLRQDSFASRLKALPIVLYGAFFEGLGLRRAFGHSNPYHRYAFPLSWWHTHTADAGMVVLNYSFWSWLPFKGPKCTVLLDLYSDRMWEGIDREARDLATCDLVQVISVDEQAKLQRHGVENIVWSPPAVEPTEMPLTPSVGIVGDSTHLNREGLRWLSRCGARIPDSPVRVYGQLAGKVATADDRFEPVGRYDQDDQPYRECGIVMMTTAQGTGVQIKAIEALAAGRAIVARKGAMRGLPASTSAWVEVATAEDMWREAARVHGDATAREAQAEQARLYYREHLAADAVRARTLAAYKRLLA